MSTPIKMVSQKMGTIKYLSKYEKDRNKVILEEIPDCFTKDTCFRLASVSKQITSISILMLVDKKIISLDDLVKRFIPELNWSSSTILHLLAHTSDIEDCYHLVNENIDYTNKDLLPIIQSNGLAPGTEYIYCNTGYDLIPIIIERITNKPYQSYLHHNIFAPLNMNNTFTALSYHDAIHEYDVAKCYYADTKKEYSDHHLNNILGSGGIFSCVNDLEKWNMGMPKLLSNELLKLAQSEITPNYGLGFEVYEDGIAHSGCWEGFNTYLAFYPKEKVSIIILSNLDDVDADQIGTNFIKNK